MGMLRKEKSSLDAHATARKPPTSGFPWRLVLFVLFLTGAVGSVSRAGDILRGGASAAQTRDAATRAKAGEKEAALTTANAQDRLARTTEAIQAVKALQGAARNAALGHGNLGMDPNHPGQRLPTVPDGLAPGGLEIIGTPTGANSPTQSGGIVTVKQNQQQAILNWKTFNIGRKTTLKFEQSSQQWVAFNKVSDPSGSPSQILGSIKAKGQVYVINQNGIIFGGGSQVNVHTLVASALPINDNLISRGLLDNPDLQFLFTSLSQAAGTAMSAFNPPAPFTPNGRPGDVTVQAGAQLTSPETAEKTGGRIMLVGPNVRNAGTISTPAGQTILAAGLQVGMTAHPSSDPSLRGLDVYVGQVGTYAGTVINTGVIDAPRASVTMAGKNVQQYGVIESTTSVSVNGRIDLLANYDAVPNAIYDAAVPSNGEPFLFKSSGLVALGEGSVTQILPETWSEETATGTELALRSQINMQGLAVRLLPNAMVLAPNAKVNVKAGKWAFTPQPTKSQFVYTGGQIYVDANAFIDVAGTAGVDVPLEHNILSVQLRGSELADSPLQRDQLLRAVTLTLDARRTGTYYGRFWVGTPLGDATGFLGLIERTAGQLTTAGGEVKLQAGEAVVLQEGSSIDVSGGWMNYLGGLVKTTRVLYRGNIIDIADATPDRIYDGIYTAQFTKTHPKWGVSKTYTNPLALTGEHYEADYIGGAAGGALSIVAPSMALDGKMTGVTVAGPRQERTSAVSSTLPTQSSLSLAFKNQDATTAPNFFFQSPTPPRVIFQTGGAPSAADPFALNSAGEPMPLRADRKAEIVLAPDLLKQSGFGALTVENSDGPIIVPAGVDLEAPPGGLISLAGSNILIDGNVSAPGGTLSFTAYNISPYLLPKLQATPGSVTPPPSPSRGVFALGAGASLNAAGLIVDDRDPESDAPIVIGGGKITIDAYTADLAEGSFIDVSGGMVMTAKGRKVFGDGGSITIETGQDPLFLSVLGGKLKLGSELRGYSGARGGSLAIQTTLIRVGGAADHEDALVLSPEFFNKGGFSQFSLTGLGVATGEPEGFLPGVIIAPGLILEPVAQSYIAHPHGNGGKIAMVPYLKPEGYRTPMSLSFNAPGVTDTLSGVSVIRGDLVMGEGSIIRTDAMGNVTLKGNTVTVLGSIYTPAGSITIAGGKDSTKFYADQDHALSTVFIGSNSVLSAAGKVLLSRDPYGRRIGTVLPGGLISLSGNVVAMPGSLLDVSGASGILDLTPGQLGLVSLAPATSGLTSPLHSLRTTPTQVDSDGGIIVLEGGQQLLVGSTLLGAAGGPTALGGTLVVSSGRFYAAGATPAPIDFNLVVTQTGNPLAGISFGTGSPIGQIVRDASGNIIPGHGFFSVESFQNGGFDNLALKGVVKFLGPISIDARGALLVADGGVLYADSLVNLKAAYVQLGKPFEEPTPETEQTSPFLEGGNPFHFMPTNGPGRLVVTAPLIDIGTLSLQNIGLARFIADNGEIRGNGTLNIAGDIYMRAAQIYPVSGAVFNIVAYDYLSGGNTVRGSVTFEKSGVLPLPLSAGGQLNVFASVINQNGVLRAPLGSINLGWDGTGTPPKDPITGIAFPVAQEITLGSGSITSVSAIDPITGEGVLIPYGLNLNGTSWIDPAGNDITAGGGPNKFISISGANVNVAEGSVIDIRGGGDIYSYRWVQGNGGTQDILASETSFAVIPGWATNYAPFAPFNTTTASASNLGGDPGYVNSTLKVGDRIYLGASEGRPAGYYTLLPARYALLPGAFLVTPVGRAPQGTIALADGSSFVSGYRYSDLNSSRRLSPIYSTFEVAPASVVRSRAEYEDYFGNSFLLESALALDQAPPRLAMDAGHLVLQATTSMNLAGTVMAKGAVGGRGGWIDIASTSDILITGPGVNGGPGLLVLDATQLSSFGAESLLIGGVRTVGANGTTVTVKTNSMIVDNADSPLSAPEIILVANRNLILTAESQILQSGPMGGPGDTLLLNGDGLLLRVSGDGSAQTIRTNSTASTIPTMTIGAGVVLAGAGITLDSTFALNLNPAAVLDASSIALNAGRISVQFNNPGALQPGSGLVLSGEVLNRLEAASRLSLLSYSTLDLYGTGQFDARGSLAIHAAEIRGFNNGGGLVQFNARDITLDNRAGRTGPGAVAAMAGTLEFNANKIHLGINNLAVDQFANLNLNAAAGIFLSKTGGLSTQGALKAVTPFIVATDQAAQTIKAGGALIVDTPAGWDGPIAASALGASLTLEGGSVSVLSDIRLPSGQIKLHATNGDVFVSGLLDVAGTAQQFYDVTKYTHGGDVTVSSDTGSVTLAPGSIVTVAAQAGGGNAGSLSIITPQGAFTLDGELRGQGGAGGLNGSFSLDVGSLPTLAALNTKLNAASFTEARLLRVRNGDVLVDGIANARLFSLSADNGSISVAGTINASGATGGAIGLSARGSVTLLDGSVLTTAAQDYNSAGKGGLISLEAGAQYNGVSDPTAVLDIQAGSLIDLSVQAAARPGQFGGVLHLRAPQTAGNTDLQIDAIDGSIVGASAILAEGYRIYDLTGSGDISSTVQADVMANGVLFAGNTAAMTSRLLANNASLASLLVIAPGAEIINRTGNLTLGAADSTEASDWNLAGYRFGPKNVAGVLTMRAAGDLVFYNALSDGFVANPANSNSALYNYILMEQNPLLPVNMQSWSYRLVAGADFTAADYQRVNAAGTGSLKLGKDNGVNASNSNGTNNPGGANAQTSLALLNRYQVIRTGSGDINVVAARDVQLLNQFATIYTAGTKVSDPTMGGLFDLPILDQSGAMGSLGSAQQSTPYPAQYSMGGGNVTINAGRNIGHYTLRNGELVADSGRQLPMNWLYRRGYIDPLTGNFGAGKFGDIAWTSWWVDFSNFFQGVGALGGGNVSLIAGNDISNVDAVVPTNARMTGKDSNGNAIAADAANLLELGGGDLLVKAGHDIDAGVYYVERGKGTLAAGNSIKTNSTRSPSLTNLVNQEPLAPETWLPTTLFLGKGGYDVSARGDILMGPVANPFLLPGGFNNTYWYKTYFSTYDADGYVNVSSLGGSVTLREGTTLPSGGAGTVTPMLQAWMQRALLLTLNPQSASFYQPWIRLNESSVSPFGTVASLLPASLRVTSFTGDINVVGKATLAPSPRGTLELLAAGSINGLQPNGVVTLNSISTRTWGAASLNLSDASPVNVPGIASPFAYQAFLGESGTAPGSANATQNNVMLNIDRLFKETGSTEGVLQVKQSLHSAGLLHAGDPNPARLYARAGNISGLTFFSPKFAKIHAGRDITDIALYLQNVSDEDVSVVSSGRDIVAYSANSPLRVSSRAAGNIVNLDSGPLAGDIQVSGPGLLEVLAGRNLDLGTGENNPDGTGVGITSIGNGRNPFLPLEGASVVVAAGIGPATSLSDSEINFDEFISRLDQSEINRYLSELDIKARDLESLPAEQRNRIALQIFYLVLRDAGRNYATVGNYDSGFAAIEALFGSRSGATGGIFTRSRDIRTKSGGDISMLIPGGGLELATANVGTPLAPPGIITEAGGRISIFANDDIDIGISRIFTLRGGDEILWSSQGDIAAGSSAKTVKSAPPTRVLIDPQSADVQTDLAGLATGGGIGVLATVEGVPPGDVDLIAPNGVVDAGDAGIRVSGNLNIAATAVLNASNISVGGASAGVPTAAVVAAPNIGGLTSAASVAGAGAQSANAMSKPSPTPTPDEMAASSITVDVLGYGEDEGE